MFSVKAHKQQNLLVVTFKGDVCAVDGPYIIERMEVELKKVKKGFSLITDLSQVDMMESKMADFIKKSMFLCNAHGVVRIYRVIPDNTKDVGFNIMSTFHYDPSVKIYQYKTMLEARSHFLLKTDITLSHKLKAVLRIVKMKGQRALQSVVFQVLTIILGFIFLVMVRSYSESFGVSLGYLYITLISLAGFWFGVKGGILSALCAMVVFVVEVNIHPLWRAHDVAVSSLSTRFIVFLLSGLVIGLLSEREKKLRASLESLAGQDAVTGVFNERFILNTCDKEYVRAARYQKKLSIAMIDLDGFKKINENYGWLVGDDVLASASNVIQGSVRAIDYIGRYGEDKFLCLFPEADSKQVKDMCERICTQVESTKFVSPNLVNKKFVTCTVSIGVASYQSSLSNTKEMLAVADGALYQAKKNGRNQTAFM